MLAVFISLLVQFSAAIDLPAAPADFTWQEVPELKAAFLKPNGWYFKREQSKETLAYFITRESIESGGQFRTGLTINVFRGLPKGTAIERGRSLVQQIATEHHVRMWTQDAGPFREFGCLAKNADDSGTIVMHTLTVANPKTDTLYLFIFESPESDWESAWKIGKQIMDALAVDDEI